MAGCCWKPVSHQMGAFDYTSSTPLPGAHGIIPLIGHEDCAQPYNGEHRGQTMYLVRWKLSGEKLFKAVDSKVAAAYAKTFDPQARCTPVPATQLCWAAVDALYAETPA